MPITPSQQIETILCNKIGKTAYRFVDGSQYLVCPMVILKEGVLNGSKGPLYYDREDIQKSCPDWERIPLVAYHPSTMDGQFISANEQGILDRQGIGFFTKPTFATDRIKGFGYFNIDRLRKVNQSILNSLKANKQVELSTGLFTTNYPVPDGSHYQGKAYTHRAMDYRPDHIAVLPDQIGACSLNDGCGVLVNSATIGNLKLVDFVEFPSSQKDGTRCTNCQFSDGAKTDDREGTCTFNGKMPDGKTVDLRGIPIYHNTCCSAWEATGVTRPWKKEVAGAQNSASPLVPNLAQTLTTEVFSTLLHAATSAHILHFGTDSLSVHLAMDTLYKKLPKLVDKLVEEWQGINQVVVGWPSGYSPPENDPPGFVQSVRDYLVANRGSLGSISEVQNRVDDILALLDNTLYRLKYLS